MVGSSPGCLHLLLVLLLTPWAFFANDAGILCHLTRQFLLTNNASVSLGSWVKPEVCSYLLAPAAQGCFLPCLCVQTNSCCCWACWPDGDGLFLSQRNCQFYYKALIRTCCISSFSLLSIRLITVKLVLSTVILFPQSCLFLFLMSSCHHVEIPPQINQIMAP